jgi:hypothetical protein
MLGVSLVTMLALSGIGCGDDDSRSEVLSTSTSPLYLIATYFNAGDQQETYLVTSSTFDAQTKINPTDGIKVLGGVIPIVHNGSVFVTDSNAPVLQRYQPGPGDRLAKTAELSFAGVGVAEIGSWYIYIVSDTKAYLFDPGGPRIVVWNPSTMALTGVQIDLAVLKRDTWSPSLALEQTGPQRRGAELLIPLSWADQDGAFRFASGLLVLDTNTDTVVAVSEDERAGEAYVSIPAPNGDIYYFPSGASAAQHFFAESHRPTRVLRVKAGERAFDKDYALDLSALGSGLAAAGAIPDGVGGFFFETADQALWDARANNGEAFYRLSHYSFNTQASRPLTNFPVWAGSTYWVLVDGKVVIPYWEDTPTGGKTTVYIVNGEADPTPLFSFDAEWYGFSRIR